MSIENLKFSKDHEWVRAEGSSACVGISDFAQRSLGDIVYVELPKIGAAAVANKVFSSVESVKAVSDVLSPVSGKVAKVNDVLEDSPELLNEAPYDNWIAEIELENPAELDALMSYAEYEEFCARQ